jgi:hypothetical protein
LWTVAVLSRAEISAWLPRGNVFGKHVAICWEGEDFRDVKGVMPEWLAERDAQLTRRPLASWEGVVRSREGREFQQLAIARVVGSDRSEKFQALSFFYGSPWVPPIIPVENVVLAPDLPRRLLGFFGMDGLGESLSWQGEPPLVSALPHQGGERSEVSIMSLLEDVHSALLMAPKNVSPYRLIRLRLDNLFIHDFFDGLVDLSLERGTEHDCLPLLLALGFSQYQTTWSWPRSHHWKQWFSFPPPEDWLAAFFWHLCWAVGDVDRYPEHYADAQACLDRADWPELAAELRAYTIRPMTVEEWQRNADPPTPPMPSS